MQRLLVGGDRRRRHNQWNETVVDFRGCGRKLGYGVVAVTSAVEETVRVVVIDVIKEVPRDDAVRNRLATKNQMWLSRNGSLT